ncbi:Na+/H+ antiporter subunit C [Oceanispirochaeta crateris]|jgi:multicomponent Na+:H+ antiporter subunit C|uniref:Na+/H+ antiporter subunit C n=1 Tax=Oceanispirochaeta crateris TaxID=2518645 RepID=A0A5C1QNJ7_9SPIO|nr:sodium:proton antiporter [Oceanispirochaeta crateris]QEN08918.1 Na+/H+ antiporter subunit C [Oceanispirochaeta crateris]
MVERILILILSLIGLWGIVYKKNIIKKIYGLTILNSSVVILFILEGSQIGKNAPIMGKGVRDMVDPVPQALMLTAIVIGVCITALSLAIAFRLYRFTGSFDIDEIREKVSHGTD